MFAGHAILLAYFVTLVTEIVVVSLFRINPRHVALIAVVLVNSFTHPLIVGYGIYIFDIPIAAAEVLIFLIESVWYQVVFRHTIQNAILLSFAANCTPFLVGVLVAECLL